MRPFALPVATLKLDIVPMLSSYVFSLDRGLLLSVKGKEKKVEKIRRERNMVILYVADVTIGC
jgi:hypothetical protein